MRRNKIILIILALCNSCAEGIDPVCQSIYRSESASVKTKTFLCGDGGYKHRCEKPGQCCEVGVDCDEDKKNNP